jgi:hypothetical protein
MQLQLNCEKGATYAFEVDAISRRSKQVVLSERTYLFLFSWSVKSKQGIEQHILHTFDSFPTNSGWK